MDVARMNAGLVTLCCTVGALGCTTAHFVNGKRVDESAVVLVQPADAAHRDTPPRQRHDVHETLRDRDAAARPAAHATRMPRPPAARLRRFRRHGDNLVKGWRYGAVGDPRLLPVLQRAETAATEAGLAVLRTGRALILQTPTVIRGSCWTYANAVYKRAGVTRRHAVFKSSRDGPYADPDGFQPGDFLSYINHSHHGGVHSAIFVDWVDRAQTEALMMSYVGGRKSQPGGYRTYLLTHVYRVQRSVADP